MTSYQFMLSVLWKWMIIQETVDMCFFYGCADWNHKEARSSPRTFWELVMKFFCQGMEEAMQLWHYIGDFRNERGSNLEHGVFQIHVCMNLFCCVEPLHLSQAFKLHCLCWNSCLRCLLVCVDWNQMFLLGGWHSFFIFMRFWVQFLVQRLAIINRFFLSSFLLLQRFRTVKVVDIPEVLAVSIRVSFEETDSTYLHNDTFCYFDMVWYSEDCVVDVKCPESHSLMKVSSGFPESLQMLGWYLKL